MLTSIFRHWLPILTFCPVNGLPDLIYITIFMSSKDKDGNVVDLYKVRKRVRAQFSGRRMFMEEVAEEVQRLYPDANQIEVHLAFNRHIVTIIP